MSLNKRAGRCLALYSSALGVLYLVVGSIEFLTGFWDLIMPGAVSRLLGLPLDLYGGFAALVTGFVYFGAIPLWRGRLDHVGYVLVGVLLSAIFSGVYILIVLADGLSVYISHLAGEAWTWEWLFSGTAGTGLLRPEIWLGLLSIPLGYSALKRV